MPRTSPRLTLQPLNPSPLLLNPSPLLLNLSLLLLNLSIKRADILLQRLNLTVLLRDEVFAHPAFVQVVLQLFRELLDLLLFRAQFIVGAVEGFPEALHVQL
jgi:hypothetical protein